MCSADVPAQQKTLCLPVVYVYWRNQYQEEDDAKL